MEFQYSLFEPLSNYNIPNNYFIIQDHIRGPDKFSIIGWIIKNISEICVGRFVVDTNGFVGVSCSIGPGSIIKINIHPGRWQLPMQTIECASVIYTYRITGRGASSSSTLCRTKHVFDRCSIECLRFPFTSCCGDCIAFCIMEYCHQSSITRMVFATPIFLRTQAQVFFPVNQLHGNGEWPGNLEFHNMQIELSKWNSILAYWNTIDIQFKIIVPKNVSYDQVP